MGYIRQNCGIYRAKIRGYTMGYNRQKLWDIFDKNLGVYWVKLWEILWDILVKQCWIYLEKNYGMY